MATFNVNMTEIAVFLAIFLRMSIVLFMIPVFRGSQLPGAIKAPLIVALSVMVYLLPHNSISPLSFHPAPLFGAVLGEMIFGMIMGLMVLLIFGAFQIAGELITFQMGFGFAQVADPQSGSQVTVISRFFQVVATLIFFGMNGHHVVIRAIVESYRTIPIGSFALTTNTYHDIVALSGRLFPIAIQLSAPITIALMLTHLALGLMSKFSPQLNIIATSFPLTILIGFALLALSVSLWEPGMEKLIGYLFQLLKGFAR